MSTFPQYPTHINEKSPKFQEIASKWTGILADFAGASSEAASESKSLSALGKHTAGQLLARDRIALLRDPGTPCLELCAFAGHRLKDYSPSASLVAGIGVVSGVICLIFAHIPSLQGEAWNEFTVLKQNRIRAIATENKLPLIALVQSAGVFLPQQFKVFHKGGQMFRDLALRSKNGQSSCAVVFGSSTAGGAYHPALSDYTIFVQDQAQVFLGGPPLVKMATGEVTDAETLGGADMHSTITGLSDQLAVDEFDAIRKVKEWVYTTSAAQTQQSRIELAREAVNPKFDIESLLVSLIPTQDSRWI
ncbi:putative methylcrotonoyl-CoA carboxylase beta chain, mitochondrial [Lachnellula occidentalis]|uniref:methylcrotonoyl-CoA carboxylase n=1 Tax=Lachnellula occidentalis TaxID=215460 RepID=A0A8H8U5R8_9HELO|nr:putative methylcrotonoyl-CoA carboxylase beta chain, mitochondrial [Lachnellula occidentalis]